MHKSFINLTDRRIQTVVNMGAGGMSSNDLIPLRGIEGITLRCRVYMEGCTSLLLF